MSNQLMNPSELMKSLAAFKAAAPKTSGGNLTYMRLLKAGYYVYGRDEVEVEEGSRWAVDLSSLAQGYQCWPQGAPKPVGEELARIGQPPIFPQNLPDHGAEWVPLMSMHLVCVDGEDEGTHVVYKAATRGAVSAFEELLEVVFTHLDAHPEDVGKSPLIELDMGEWKTKYGRIYHPIFKVVDWATGPDDLKADAEGDSEGDATPEPVAEPAKPRRGRPAKAATQDAAPATPARRRRRAG